MSKHGIPIITAEDFVVPQPLNGALKTAWRSWRAWRKHRKFGCVRADVPENELRRKMRDVWGRAVREVEGAYVVDVDYLVEQVQQGHYWLAHAICLWLAEYKVGGKWDKVKWRETPLYYGDNPLIRWLSHSGGHYVRVVEYGSTDIPPSGEEFTMPDGQFGFTFGVDGVLRKPWYADRIEGVSNFFVSELGLDPEAVSRGAAYTRRVLVIPTARSVFRRKRAEVTTS